MVKLGKKTIYTVGRKKFRSKKAAMDFARKKGKKRIGVQTIDTVITS